jgi:hypothetical protein
MLVAGGGEVPIAIAYEIGVFNARFQLVAASGSADWDAS